MSSDVHHGGDRSPPNSVPAERYEILGHPRRLHLLEILDERSHLSLAELTTELIDREGIDGPVGKARHEVRIDLVHNHLPRLAEFGLVDWSIEDGVELVEEPPIRTGVAGALIEEYGAESVDQLFDPVRIRLLQKLDSSDRPISLEQLASALAGHGTGSLGDTTESKIALHHNHLPALADLGILEYDRESELVTLFEDVPFDA
ncbi:ArsR family transcriptional regulator [Natrialba sp. INN-245]|uniref:DUF7344 domain-containing protein n=1 Tax=Natrialba sp. INN-245 TaxID=2690967 RepID=UPI001311C3AD|nr:ArsR family transcriptional regulator [Natrialba sp. INN-245]MWV40540.1 ArsR family transcriptional regulator [Natrialba sp. INN-245]